MRVTVITPTYNGSRHIADTIKSVQAQTLTDWRHLIIDDGSSDDTVAICTGYAEKDARIEVIQQANGGVVNARNRGLRELDPACEFVAFLDHDDVWEPKALELLTAAMDDDPAAVGAHGLMRFIDKLGSPMHGGEPQNSVRRGIRDGRIVIWPQDQPTTYDVLILFNTMGTPGQGIMRADTVRKAGSFDKATEPADDWEMWLRLSLRGHIAFVNQTVINYRLHDSNASRNEERIRRSHLSVWRKYMRWSELTPEQRELAGLGHRLFQEDVMHRRLNWMRTSLREGKVHSALLHFRQAMVVWSRALKGPTS